MNRITVEAYSPVWRMEFERAERFYSELLQGLDITIEHVGSTSVEGLWAKPILDIDIIVRNAVVRDAVICRLAGVGYVHQGDLGIEGREAFRNPEHHEQITAMDHHLYVCMDGCENLRNHLMLRRHLSGNPGAVEAYGRLKRELAERYPHDIDAYVEDKTALITEMLKKEGMGDDGLARIREINRKQ